MAISNDTELDRAITAAVNKNYGHGDFDDWGLDVADEIFNSIVVPASYQEIYELVIDEYNRAYELDHQI